ncbi:MAG: type IV pilus modification protein PilV [Cellvibrionaceae bacterium]
MLYKKIQGFSMIEVLITIFIMAVGLLGLAALQMVSVKNVNNTQYRTLATIYAYDMAERIRSNREGRAGYNNIEGDEGAVTCNPTPCSAAEMAARDAYEWNEMISDTVNTDDLPSGLPNGVGTVVGDGVTYAITVSWDEQDKAGADGSEAQSFTLNITLD